MKIPKNGWNPPFLSQTVTRFRGEELLDSIQGPILRAGSRLQGSSQVTNMANAGKSPFFNRRLEIQMHLHSNCCYFPATVYNRVYHVSLPAGGVVSTLFFPAVYQQKKLLQGVPQADAWDFWSPWWWSTTLHETNSSHLKGWHCNGKVAFQSSGGYCYLLTGMIIQVLARKLQACPDSRIWGKG